MKKSYVAILMAIAFLPSCKEETSVGSNEITYSADTVRVRAGSPILSRLEINEVALEPFSAELRTVGTVRAENGKYAEVGLPFDGRIISSSIRPGSRVRKGDPLFEVSSPELLEAGKNYFQSTSEYEKASADYLRKKALKDAGIVSQRELDEALAASENARHNLNYAESALKVYGLDPSRTTLDQTQKIISPISGEILKTEITPGSFVKSDSEPLVIIADLHRVWIGAQIKERYLGELGRCSSADIFTESDPDTPIKGTIIYEGNLVDPETRSVEVILSCDNPDGKLKHGMYVSVHFISELQNTILVPSTAVFQGEKQSFVYLATSENGVFLRRTVETGPTNDDKSRILIRSGLNPGERIIEDGGLYLND